MDQKPFRVYSTSPGSTALANALHSTWSDGADTLAPALPLGNELCTAFSPIRMDLNSL